MDVKLVLVLLCAAVIGVYCKPAKGPDAKVADTKAHYHLSDQEYYDTLNKAMVSLTDQVAAFRDALQKKRKTEINKDVSPSLEDSLKKAVAEDRLKRGAVVKVEVPEDIPKEDTKKSDSSFFKDDADYFNYDFDEYEDAVAKKEAKSPALKPKEDTLPKSAVEQIPSKPVKDTVIIHEAALSTKRKQQDAEIVVPEIYKDADELDSAGEKAKAEKKREMVEIGSVVKGIKNDIRSITKSFKEMKRVYADSVKQKPLEEGTRMKFETVKMDINDVMDEFKQIKALFTAKRGVVEDEPSSTSYSNGEVKGLLTDMKDQLKDASDAIMELKQLAKDEKESEHIETATKTVKDEVKSLKTAEVPVKPMKKDVPDGSVKPLKKDVPKDMAKLASLKEELRDVIHDMRDVKVKIQKENAKPARKREVDSTMVADARLNDIKEELDLIRDEVKLIKGNKAAA